MEALEPRRGRPRKFSAPSRAVTLTLPEHVIAALGAVDSDLSRAIVQLTQPTLGMTPKPAAELSRFGNHAVIVVTPTRALAERTGIEFVPLPDGRALISFRQAMTIAELELLIEDAVDDHRLSTSDHAVFEALAGILRSARRSNDVTLLQRNIIVLEAHRGKPRKARAKN
ncbi:MAG TPA: hypothetical protein VNJ03_01895 [Vicinamibacterales bacterium]|nr:hypothetical protein [Vicinamibacterales bacterium]